MVCYKAVQPNWNKPTNPVQPFVNKPPQQNQKPNLKPANVEPQFACQDIRYKDQDTNKQNSDQSSNNRYNHNNREDYDLRNHLDSRQNYYRDQPKSGQQGPPTRQSQPNDGTRYPAPPNQGFTNPNYPPFSHNGAQAIRMPCNDNLPPRGPPQNYPQPYEDSPRGQHVPRQHFNNGQKGQHPPREPFNNAPRGQHPPRQPFNNAPRGQHPPRQPFNNAPRGQHPPRQTFNNAPRGQPPPIHEYKPPVARPPIRLTGIDPYTNKAYGCSDTGYTGPLVPRNQPAGGPARHQAPQIRGHDLTIRQPAPIINISGNSAINRPDSYKRKQSAGRGKNSGRGRSKDIDYTYSKERKNRSCTQKDPGEGEVKAAMMKDSEENVESLGSWNEPEATLGNTYKGSHKEGEKTKKVLKKPSVSNSHILIDSDDCSDDSYDDDDDLSLLDLPSLPSIPSMLDDIVIDEQAGNYVPLGGSSQSSDQNLSQSLSVTSSAPPPSCLDNATANFWNSPSEQAFSSSGGQEPPMSEEATSLHSVQQPLSQSEAPLLAPVQQIVIEPSLSSTFQPCPPLLDCATSSADQFHTPQFHTIEGSSAVPEMHHSPDYEIELQNISSKLSSYNFGIQSDDSEDDDDDSNAQVSSKAPTHLKLTQSQSAVNKVKIGQVLKPVSTLCENEGLSHPVVVVQHRPDDFISPWCCEVTVEESFSGVGEGVTQTEAAQLAAGSIRSALGSRASCRKFLQQTNFYAKMLHFMCKLRGFFPPIYHLVIKTNRVQLTATIHGDLLHKSSGPGSADQALVSCFEACCEKLCVPIPGLSGWRQEELDYKQSLLGRCPGAVFSSRKVVESWWGDVTVEGTFVRIYTANQLLINYVINSS